MATRRISAGMWAEACEMIEQAERLHRQFFRPTLAPIAWEPPVDVFETESELWVVAALPGVDPSALEVRIADGVLTISGERRWPRGMGRARVRQLEIPHGRFQRRIALPPGAYELGRRDIADGCLTLTLRRL